MNKLTLFVILSIIFLSSNCKIYASQVKISDYEESFKNLIFDSIRDKNNYTGLASYYNNLSYYVLKDANFFEVRSDWIYLSKEDYLIISNRLQSLIIQIDDIEIRTSDKNVNANKIQFEKLTQNKVDEANFKIIKKNELISINQDLDKIRYVHLWAPLRYLSKLIEQILVYIHSNIVTNWGMVIILFTLVFKIFLIPINIYSTQTQKKIGTIQSRIDPKIIKIKSRYTGEEAHNKIMDIYKNEKITPFYSLKSVNSLFIQIPLLIAIFNVLAEMPQLLNSKFLWIDDIAYPDSFIEFSFSLPFFGNDLNLLPIIMSGIVIFSTFIYDNDYLSQERVKKQKNNLFLMAIVFFILFYPFPAAMVLFWLTSNLIQIFLQKVFKLQG